MSRLRCSGFVGPDSLAWSFLHGHIDMSGEIGCLGNIVIAVSKTLKIHSGADQSDWVVETIRYAYNASVRNHGSIMRYDNAHAHSGHPDAHHRHRFDWRTGTTIGGPEWVGSAKWPTLAEFILEVEEWYYANQSALPIPDVYPGLCVNR